MRRIRFGFIGTVLLCFLYLTACGIGIADVNIGEAWMKRAEAMLVSAFPPAKADETEDMVEKFMAEGVLAVEKTEYEEISDGICTAYTEETITWNGEDAQDAAKGYIHQVLYAEVQRETQRGQRSIGASLTGLNGTLYGYLRRDIGAAAAGERTSTVFRYETETLLDQTTFTAEDLNVDAVCFDGELTQEAIAAARAKFKKFNSSSIVYALLADCPFDLYWYNKAAGGGCRVASSLQCVKESEETVTVNGYIKFSFTVAQDYAKAEYEIDPAYGQGVSAAAENARSIVDQYEGLDDYDRLLAYKNEICALASYNSPAAQNTATPYGNPWQLVWVFDGDPETKVVCEGYAKAFQYLNDLSAGDAVVISTQGLLDGRAHMWNVVAMDDGKNYLADLTNCDNGMAGYPDKLFLAGCVSGGVTEGYRFSVPKGSLLYSYGTNAAFSENDLKIAPWDYTAGGPPVPAFQAAETQVFEWQTFRFDYLDNGFVYDRLIAEIMYEPAEGEMDTIQETVEIDDLQAWEMFAQDYGPGEYSIHFAGVRDDVQSAWSEEIPLQVLDFREHVPVYAFSAQRGYAGWQAAVRFEDEADSALILETGEEIPCEEGIALLPLDTEGDFSYTLAVKRMGVCSAYGETRTINVTNLSQDAVLAIPAGVRTIEEEAFQGVGASRILLPDTVTAVGPYAFADNPGLLFVEMGEAEIAMNAFDGCPNAMLGVPNAAWGFETGLPFLTHAAGSRETETGE